MYKLELTYIHFKSHHRNRNFARAIVDLQKVVEVVVDARGR